ncbi:MAG: hypothetical protein H0W36_05205 [Gemmatimonadetes bacterium]|nr:hypothetical protein [Gemmatimonadota bacterium]
MGNGGPQNATVNGDGFRFYRWQEAGSDESYDLLSVTSIRKLCGEQFSLVNWQLNNLMDTVMGTVKRPAIGKRGGPLKGKNVYVPEEYPSEFVERYLASDASQPKLDELRKWTREQADQPRNIAAMRGTIVHAAIEKNVQWSRIERPWVEAEFQNLSSKDKARAKAGVTDADVTFVRRAVANYWDMRRDVPFVIIAREPQVFNLSMGYGGSADALCWFLPEGHDGRDLPKAHQLNLKLIQSIGGYLAVGDWKTSQGVYTDQVVQVHAYGAGEFVGEDGVINHRLTDILQATSRGVLFHIRPEKWATHLFDFSDPVYRAFAGSVAFARFLAEYPRADKLFIENHTGFAPEEEAA